MKIQKETFTPVTIEIETKEEWDTLLACMSINEHGFSYNTVSYEKASYNLSEQMYTKLLYKE